MTVGADHIALGDLSQQGLSRHLILDTTDLSKLLSPHMVKVHCLRRVAAPTVGTGHVLCPIDDLAVATASGSANLGDVGDVAVFVPLVPLPLVGGLAVAAMAVAL